MTGQTQDRPQGPPHSYYASQSTPCHNDNSTRACDLEPPPYHNWQEAVPDTTTFPPPPVSGFYSSGAGNASSDDADRAHEFCDRVSLYAPVKPSAAVYSSVQRHDLRPVQPNEFRGSITSNSQGRWKVSTSAGSGDCLLSTNLPLFFPFEDSPFHTEKRKTIYFEVKLLGLRAGPGTGSVDSSGFSIGFVAHPYPYWRSPGWERGSLGVFSDDGCRFVNDSWGGRDFTSEFRVGETVGLGMTFSLPDNVSAALRRKDLKPRVDVFFIRDGQRVGGWNLHEEVDQEAGGVNGLEGDFDLYGTIGLFGGVDIEVCFDPAGWLWHDV